MAHPTLPLARSSAALPAAGTTPVDSSERSGWWTSRAVRTGSVLALLVGTAVLYIWHLSASGYGNSFYSAAVQAGSQSWKAFFFGSLDAGNAITVDKPPASLWLMALSVRVFGLSSWSILVPQALLGVATVGVLYASVRRTSGHLAGLLAGALLAITPAAALMFRFNNPDALLVFLLTLATYVTLRATEKASSKWLVGAGVLIGLAFLTKMLQAFLVLPAFVLVYLLFAPTTLRRRLLHLLTAFAAVIVSLGWWVAIVELVPASWRPYVGGSENDSILDLVFGYNGLGRIFGQGGGGGRAGGGFGGQTGVTRLFTGVSGGMITWLIPAALVLGAVALLTVRSQTAAEPDAMSAAGPEPAATADQTRRVRAAIVVWAGWLLVTGLIFSFMAGTYHEYYTVALSPAIAALVVVAGAALWSRRTSGLARSGLAAGVLITAAWAFVLLGRATGGYQTLRWPVAALGLVAAVGLVFAHRLPRVLASAILGVAVLSAGAGPAAYAFNTVATPHQGSIVTAGPVSGGGSARPGGRNTEADGQRGRRSGGQPAGQPPQGGAQPGGSGGGGFGGQAAGTNADLVARLQADSDSYTWAAATTGSQGAASYQLASGRPVMAIGGFTGSDPSPTLEQFKADVTGGKIHYYISGGNRGGPSGGSSPAAQIATWVADNYTATTVGSATVYDLTQPA